MATIRRRELTLKEGQTKPEVRYEVQIRKKGYKDVFICERKLEVAKRKYRNTLSAMDEGTWDDYSKTEIKKGRTILKGFVKQYLEEITPTKRGGQNTITNETATLNLILNSKLADMDVYKIKLGHIKDVVKEWQANGNAASTVNRKLSTLSSVFRTIIEDWKHDTLTNPVKGARLKESSEQRRQRKLSPAEYEAVREALKACKSKYIAWLFELALETGARRRELFENTWGNVSFNEHDEYLLIPAEISQKTEKSRYVPLTPRAIELLTEMKEFAKHTKSTSDLFPITQKSFEEAWKKTVKRSGVTNFQFRDSRSIGITMLSKIYPKAQDLARISGHTNLKTLLGYYQEDKTEQIAMMREYYKKAS